MGRLRFGVAFAVTGKELEGVTPDLTNPHRGGGNETLTLALSPREREQRGRDIRKEASPEGGGNGGGELKGIGCKGKLSGIRHSGQSESQQDTKAKRMPEGKRNETLETTHRNCWNGS